MSIPEHIPTVFLVAATGLLIVTCLSVPTIGSFSLAQVTERGVVYRFGVLGFCQGYRCSPTTLGYRSNPKWAHFDMSWALPENLERLSVGLIMHPVATAFSAIALAIAIVHKHVGLYRASIFTFVAWLCSAIAMAVDLSMFGQMKARINASGRTGVTAEYGLATWITIIATVLLFLGTGMTLFNCMKPCRDKSYSPVDSYSRELGPIEK